MNPLPRFVPNWSFTRLVMWLVFLAWIAVLIYASNRTGFIGAKPPILHWDKFLHFAFFSVGAMVFGACLRATFPWRWSVIVLFVIAVLSALALIDEMNQLHVTGRSGGDPFDWLADLFGSIAGLAVLTRFYAKPSAKNTRTPTGD